MILYYIKTFMYIFVLRILVFFHKINAEILLYENQKYIHQYNLTHKRCLTERISVDNSNKNRNQKIILKDKSSCNTLKEKKCLLSNKNVANPRKGKKKKVENKLQYKNDKKLETNKSKNSDSLINRIKNNLYEIIFKGKYFWRELACFLRDLGIFAFFNFVVAILNYMASFLPTNCICTFSAIAISAGSVYGITVFIMLITIVIVGLLVLWLWPKDDKLVKEKVFGHK
ncbi:Plasmodium exported protein (hyp5), unknown function [Plasmodium sp. gorilla clade G1]|nr:Plasmodium exported protein (hyp5), unknown function [Plasmodium sp. gorilla clade G1]